MKALGNKKKWIFMAALILGTGLFLKSAYKVSTCQTKARDLIDDHKKLIDIGAVLVDSAKAAKLSEKQMALLRRLVLARHAIKSFDETQIKRTSQMDAYATLNSAILDLKESSKEILAEAVFFPTNTGKHTVPRKTIQTLWDAETKALKEDTAKAFQFCLPSR